MEPNNNFNILAWYNSLDKQNHRKFYVYGKIWGLVSPNNALLPFQVVRNTTASGIIGLDIYKLDGTFVRSVLSDVNIKVLKFDGYDIIKYHGDTFSNPLPIGKYYLKMMDGTNTWYSEVFSVVPDISSFIKLEYWNNDNLYYKDGHIDYSEGFKFCCYLCTAIGKPGYNFEEELTERDGYKFIEKQVSSKVYNMTFAAPEFICDALRLVRMCDNIRITDKDDVYKILSFTVDPKWEDNGDLASVDTEFETDTVVTKITNVLNGPSEGGEGGNFIDALLYEKDGPIMFDQNVVAQYQRTVTVYAEGVSTGKLIRELESYGEEQGEEIFDEVTIPIDLGYGPAKKISLKKAVGAIGKDIYLRKDINDTAHGIISFDLGLKSSIFLDGFEGKGWQIVSDTGSAIFGDLRIRQNVFIGNRLGSPTFVSGFPNGIGWDLAPYKRINAAEVEETKYRLEIDDIIVRGKLRVFEMIISQLRGENDNVIFAGMMKVDHYDKESGRIYLDTDEGVIYNPFRPGDILMVQRFGGMPSEDNDYNVIKQYELRVEEVGVGNLEDKEKRLDWLTFTNFVGEIEDIAAGDVLTRVDSVSDSTRKGIVKVTTIDEIGAPYIDVVYGMKTDPLNATKVRMGNLSGIRPKSGVDLTGVWGLYANGAYFENSTYVLENGNTIEQEFSIMNGEFRSEIEGIKNDISLESGNILKNSSFSDNLDYWVTDSTVSFFSYDAQFIYANQYFLSEKGDGADIYQDGDKNVLRLKNSYILQRNSVMDLPYHDTVLDAYDYSFSFFYKVLSAGRLQVGFENTALYEEVDLSESSSYSKFSKASTWNEQGDFKIAFTGEILIYGVSVFPDKLAESIVHLQTQIDQNSEAIKLAATKEYVDEKTGEVYIKYDSQFEVTATQISGISSRVDNINNTINTAGWITESEGNTLFASKALENGNKIISYINQTATTTTINSSRINLRGAVTFSDLNTSLQDMINNPDSEALDKAIEAYNRADAAYTRANSAYTNASTAQSRADSAYSRASTAISDAADALNAANAAQTSVNNLPGWTKEKDIISALEDATVIVNGYIATSMIDVNNLYAKKLNATEGYVGGFHIHDDGLEGTTSGCYIMITGGSSSGGFVTVGDAGSTLERFLHAYAGKSGTIGLSATGAAGGIALETNGPIRFKGLSSITASSSWKNLLVNTSTGEIRMSN